MTCREEIINEALKWRNFGVGVVPARYMSKAPLVKWTPWIGRTPPSALIDHWFRSRWPCNLAVVLSSGLSVVDFDTPLAYANWKIENPHLAESLTTKTSRGWHVYVWLMIWDPHTYHFAGGEVKCNGIVVAPPSVHGSGREYKFVDKDARILGAAGVDDLGVRILQIKGYQPCKAHANRESSDTISRIKSDINIALWLGRYTGMKDMGDGSFMARCIFHKDQQPSLQIWPDEGKCYCHSPACRAHRKTDVVAAAAMYLNISMAEAVGILAQEL